MPIIPHIVPLDEAMLIGRWDCGPLNQQGGRTTARRSIRTFSQDGRFELFDPARPGEPLARGEWVLEGPQLVVSEIELLSRNAAAAIRPASADVLMLTDKALFMRGGHGDESPLLSCGKIAG